MAFSIRGKSITDRVVREMEKVGRQYEDSVEKLSSGQIFTQADPRPAERALAEGLEFRVRSLAAAKRNINDAVSLLQTAESGFGEVNNILTRMKELNVSAASTTLTNQERRYVFLEYEALYDEVRRIALTTEFNGIPLLNGQSPDAPEELVFRVGDPTYDDERGRRDEDLNTIRFRGIKQVVMTPEGLGIKSARELLEDSNEEDGLDIDDVQEMMEAKDPDLFATAYDQAINVLSTQRAVYGALQSRLQRAMDYVDVYQENIAAAKSKIADTDYASEVSNLARHKILLSAATSVLSQANFTTQMSHNLLAGLIN